MPNAGQSPLGVRGRELWVAPNIPSRLTTRSAEGAIRSLRLPGLFRGNR